MSKTLYKLLSVLSIIPLVGTFLYWQSLDGWSGLGGFFLFGFVALFSAILSGVIGFLGLQLIIRTKKRNENIGSLLFYTVIAFTPAILTIVLSIHTYLGSILY